MDIVSTNKPKRNSNYKNGVRKTVIIVLIGITALSVLSFILYFIIRPYPFFVSTFNDKFRYCLKIPNDSLIDRLYDNSLFSEHRTIMAYKEDHYERVYIYNINYGLLDRYDTDKFYIMLDTITENNCLEIDKNSLYMIECFNNRDDLMTTVLKGLTYDNYTSMMEVYKGYEHVTLMKCSKFDIVGKKRELRAIGDNLTNVPCRSYSSMMKAIDFLNKNKDEYIKYVGKCLRFNKKDVDILTLYVKLLDKSLESREYIERILEIDKYNVFANYSLARLNIEQEEWEKARNQIEIAIEHSSSNDLYKSDYYLCLAWINYNEGNKEKAELYYNMGCDGYANSSLLEEYKACAGPMLEVFSIELSSFDFSDKVLSNNTRYFSKRNIDYLGGKIRMRINRIVNDDDVKVYIKVIEPGGNILFCNPYVSEDFTDVMYISTSISKEIYGIQKGKIGSYKDYVIDPIIPEQEWKIGNYKFQIWYDNTLIASEQFVIR